MSTTYYDPLSKKWYHAQEKMFGKNKIKTEKLFHYSKKWVPFSLNEDSHRIGPIIGILTSKGKNKKLAGNGPLFLSLVQHFFKIGALSIVFTQEDLGNSLMTGYTFHPALGKWIQVSSPLPDVVYNRIPFRNLEEDTDFAALTSLLQKHNIPFFNPCFINKLEMHHLLKQSPTLKPLLPETTLLTSKKMLHDWMEDKQDIYIKPVSSAKGKGIFRIFAQENHYLMEGVHLTKQLATFNELWHELKIYLAKGPYIIQEAIEPALYNGSRYDFRILSHKTENHFIISGIGIRQSSNHQQVTTHVPHGGKILPYELLAKEDDDIFFNAIIQEVGHLFNEHLGLFGEFSLDIGKDVNGKFYLYEVNSKPMSFDEEHIENKRIKAICHLCMQLSGFPIFPH
ncbi:YheC/YheD family endospore coat-associated protein [Cytobacillus sp. FSL K6-0265]|uniref:YheC/YheD family endospore coat-associated protein n=1 Tax=Cytobacillus sp. FSL K6-0265 TaxID=2921448 RepID=UPI0030F6C5AC